jgi:uncharacterized protein (DUF1501 family)
LPLNFCGDNAMLNRRRLITNGLTGLAVSAALPNMAWAAADTDRRFIFIIQRGAADGLAILAPTGDPDFLRARGTLGEEAIHGAKLDSMFTLHPAMVESAKMFAAKQAAFAHGVASGYRERSHFDAQNVLESGALRPYGRDDGWMNRLLGLLPGGQSRAVAIAPSVPLALRGPQTVDSYAPSRLPGANSALMERVSQLYDEDKQLAPLWQGTMQTQAMAMSPDGSLRGGTAAGKVAAGLMTGTNSARVLMLEIGGWDTHTGQKGRLNALLRETDALIAAVRDGLGAQWSNTLILAATEFGRTVAYNGTGGTDHGTASAAIFYGGALGNGGKVLADWPGLAQGKLYEGRDLMPTLRFEDMVTTALSGHYALDPAQVKRTLFPDFV